jgi:hypothetical protein
MRSANVVASPFLIFCGVVLGLAILAFISPVTATAQWRPMPRATTFERTAALPSLRAQVAPQRDIANSIIIATLGSATGILVGGLLGVAIDRARDVPSEDPGLSGLIYGAAAGSALLSPALLYVAHDRQGPVARALLFSVAATSLATVAFGPGGVVLVPPLQVGISVALLH